MSSASCHHIALLPAEPHSVTISWLRETLPADSKAISDAPWSPIVRIAGSIAAPERRVSAARLQSPRLVPAATNRRGRGASRIFGLVSAFEWEHQSEWLPKRKRETRVEKQARTRAELIATAAKVFARRGYNGASVEEIAEEAGYSHGAVYSNFEGKADLFLAVFEDYMAERVRELAATQAALPPDAPLEARARALADQWMERLARDRDSVVLHMEFIAHADRDPELARRFGTRSAAMREALSRYISQYQEEAGIEPALPADELALVLRALGIGLAVESLVSPDAVRDDLYGDFVELLVTLLRDDGSAESRRKRRGGAKS